MLEKSHHGSFESCDGTLFFVIHSPEVATHVHIYRLSIVSLFVSLFVYLFVYPWVYGRVSPLQGFIILSHLYPTLPLSHSVPSFSGGVSNGRAPLGLWIITTSWLSAGVGSTGRIPLGLWIITSSWLSAGVGSTGRIPLGLWIITSSWLPAYHHFLTVTYLQDAEHGHVF